MKNTFKLFSILGLVSVVLLAACGTTATPTKEATQPPALTTEVPQATVDPNKPVYGGVIRIGIPENFSGFEVYDINRGRVDFNVTINVFDTLFTYGSDYKITGMLVDTWETPDANTWILHLRQDVKFTDGTDFNADAAKFNIEKWMTGVNKSQATSIDSVTVKDSFTLEIATNTPFPTLPVYLAETLVAMESPTAYTKLGSDGFAHSPVGSGPFMFVSWDVASGKVVLEKNKNYWRKDADGNTYPYLDGIEYLVFPDSASSALALQSGDVDFIVQPPVSQVAALQKGPDTKVDLRIAPGWVYMWVNPDIAPFNDAHVRRAVQLGIDRSALVAAGEMGLTEPALGPLAKGTWYYDPSIETSGFYGPTANIDAAKQELALSTLPKPVKFKMTYPNEAPWSTIAPLVQSQLQAVGFEVEMDGRDFGSVLDDMFAGNFQALHMDFSGKIDPALSLGRFYPCTGGYVKYCDPQVDNLLNQAAASSDLTERTQLYAQIQKIVNEDAAPIILFYYTNDIKAMRSNVMGYQNLGVQRQPMFNVWLKP